MWLQLPTFMRAYVAGVKEGIISEKPFHFGEELNKDLSLDIEGELRLVKDRKKALHEQNSTIGAENFAMKELGMQRDRMYGWTNTYVFTTAMRRNASWSFMRRHATGYYAPNNYNKCL